MIHLDIPSASLYSSVLDGFDAVMVSHWARTQPVIFILPDESRFDQIQKIITTLDPSLSVFPFPAWNALPTVSPHRAIMGQRLWTLAGLKKKPVVLTTPEAFSQGVLPRSLLQTFHLSEGDVLSQTRLIHVCSGYVRVETVREPGEYAIRGGLVDLFPVGNVLPIRLDFCGDTLESLRTFDPLTQITQEKITQAFILPASEIILTPENIARFRQNYRAHFGHKVQTDPLYQAVSEGRFYPGVEHWMRFFYETLEKLTDYIDAPLIVGKGVDPSLCQVQLRTSEGGYVLPCAPTMRLTEGLDSYRQTHSHKPIFVATTQLIENAIPCTLPHGFTTPWIDILSEEDLGLRVKRKKQKSYQSVVLELSAFQKGDFIVHRDHGIGQYQGLVTLDIDGASHDCLALVYDESAKLYVPVENIEVLSRFGGEDTAVTLDKLGSVAWQNRTARVKNRIRELAADLVKNAAQRQLAVGLSIHPDPSMYDAFCAAFPYAETEDQLAAIQDVLEDLSSHRPMDRLICGDVGFGKTEIALRAASAVVSAGYQVAVLVPTTLLCRQHFQQFQARFPGIEIAAWSRFSKEGKKIKEGLQDGRVKIVIATHGLLGKDVKFHHLGLIIIDEEQHFGVKQKERLKEFHPAVNLLTLTATPIPRTLQMALSGLREMSLIATPPTGRLAISTLVIPMDKTIIREALLKEYHRGGQVYYVSARLASLPKLADMLAEIVPEMKVIQAHGQLSPQVLERAVSDFYEGKGDILLSTQIVESGLDIPRAGTLIVHRSDLLGLAQLYQLRGRIGRSTEKGYAYFTVPDFLAPLAERRLQVIQSLNHLGAGFTLASHDMEIRGSGNLLGDEQSGQMREVGVELYQTLLEEAVLDFNQHPPTWTPQMHLGVPVLIPETYVNDLSVRLGLYRRLSILKTSEDIDAFEIELIDRFGPIPIEVKNLLMTLYLKKICKEVCIERIDVGPKGTVITFYQNKPADPAHLIEFVTKNCTWIKLRPDQKLGVMKSWDSLDDLAHFLQLL